MSRLTLFFWNIIYIVIYGGISPFYIAISPIKSIANSLYLLTKERKKKKEKKTCKCAQTGM